MSHESNTQLLERTASLIDETQGMSYIPAKLEQLVKDNDLDELRRFVNEVESSLQANLAIEHFHNNDILGERETDEVY